ncbi:Bromodomain protein [Ophiocordyceps camponoti-floridani]|uniref:Bromodomain protein n=1 Tax=Ophiocordyceps camponoti-floridani TaxID=2030778 RepID=A0A8H4QB12_9HYPO|nr:Bromodomain protein [Ophiocordyceps camponoti-floridani]
MDSKRKANGSASADHDDRSSKRRKLSDFDLSKGESRESTTAYGLNFLEQIRRTADKNGRPVATYFEKLVSRKENPEYYQQTRMPISLETIEEKLNNGEFSTLAELESYFKRMITNAKEFYSRSDTIYDDAERVRKALSNYMTKRNPAYATRRYQAQPTPLPPEDDQPDEAQDGDGDEDEDKDQTEQPDEVMKDKDDESEAQAPEQDGNDDQAAEVADDDESEQRRSKSQTAAGERDEKNANRTSKRSIVLKRRESGRLSRNPTAQAQPVQPSPRQSATPSRPDHQYEDVAYKGLSFQQAQEKLIEELLRYNEPEYESYFEPFYNLPPRSLKDYYRVVTDPTSLKKIQRMVRGTHSRNDTAGETFYEQLKKAQAVVTEPSQPKIKLKVGQSQEAPASTKKITIHVGGRGGSTDSPAPHVPQNVAPPAAVGLNGSSTATRSSVRLEAARSVSLSVPSPAPTLQPGLKTEDGSRMPAVAPAPMPLHNPGTTRPPGPVLLPHPPQPVPPDGRAMMVNGHVEPRRFRRAGKGIDDALISRLLIRLHPNLTTNNNAAPLLTMHPHPKELHRSSTVTLPHHQNRIFAVLKLPEHLYHRQYSLWVLIDKQPLRPFPNQLPNQLPLERAFEMVLRPGVNVIEAHLIAAIPRSERQPGEPEVELEIFTALIHLLRP